MTEFLANQIANGGSHRAQRPVDAQRHADGALTGDRGFRPVPARSADAVDPGSLSPQRIHLMPAGHSDSSPAPRNADAGNVSAWV
jgi:hypothetical protein